MPSRPHRLYTCPEYIMLYQGFTGRKIRNQQFVDLSLSAYSEFPCMSVALACWRLFYITDLVSSQPTMVGLLIQNKLYSGRVHCYEGKCFQAQQYGSLMCF